MVGTKKEVMEETYIPTEQEQREGFELTEAMQSLPTLVEKAELFKKGVRDQVLSGYMNPLELYRQLKIAAECIEELKKDPDLLDCAMTERDKYGKEKPVINGAIIDKGQRTTYNYKSCNDPEWNRLDKELKEREAFLKALKKELIVTDPESGETITIYPPTINISNYITVKA